MGFQVIGMDTGEDMGSVGKMEWGYLEGIDLFIHTLCLPVVDRETDGI